MNSKELHLIFEEGRKIVSETRNGMDEHKYTRKSAYQIRFCIFIDTKNFEMKFFI